MKIIGVSGKSKSGKDTFFEYYAKKKGNVVLVKFAGALKESAAEMLGVSRGNFEDQDFKAQMIPTGVNGYTYRDFLLEYGMMMRKADPNYWVKKAEQSILRQPEYAHVILTDMRFINEAKMIKGNGGTTIRIDRDVEGIDHVSDKELDDYKFDIRIDNNGTLEEFYKSIDYLIEKDFI